MACIRRGEQGKGTAAGQGMRTGNKEWNRGGKTRYARREKRNLKEKKRERKKIVVYDETVNEKCEERKTRERDGNRRRKK